MLTGVKSSAVQFLPTNLQLVRSVASWFFARSDRFPQFTLYPVVLAKLLAVDRQAGILLRYRTSSKSFIMSLIICWSVIALVLAVRSVVTFRRLRLQIVTAGNVSTFSLFSVIEVEVGSRASVEICQPVTARNPPIESTTTNPQNIRFGGDLLSNIYIAPLNVESSKNLLAFPLLSGSPLFGL